MSKKRHETLSHSVRSFFTKVSNTLLPYLSRRLQREAEEFLYRIEQRMLLFEKRLRARLLRQLMISLGVLFLILGSFYFLIEYLRFSKTFAFFLLGFIFILIGLNLKTQRGGSRPWQEDAQYNGR